MTTDPPVDPPPPAAGTSPAGAAGDETTRFAPTERYPSAAGGEAPAQDSDGGAPGDRLPVGTRLGEFEITAVVGEGGFGVVYAAIDHSLGRRVALKEYLPATLAARDGRGSVQPRSERHRETFVAGLKSFVNEARLLGGFDHPALVKVHRFWEANGTAYMAMQFLDGRNLRDILRARRAEGQPPPDEAWLLSVLEPLTEALHVIHGSHCYHRDIAPDNVMQLPDGRWLLLDFGAARRVIGDMTQALTVILKPGYAPIEQYAEVPGMRQGAWTDVYALAAVVYFAVTGRTPPPSVGRMLDDTYRPLSQLAAGSYSSGFLAAVDRALAVKPEQRTQSIEHFRRELGLGGVAVGPAATQPTRPGSEAPTRPPAAPVPIEQSPPPASRPDEGAEPPPGRRRAMPIAIAMGAVALGVTGFSVYRALAPSPESSSGAQASSPAVVATAPAPAPSAASGPAPGTVPAATAAPSKPPLDIGREVERVVEMQTRGFVVEASAPKTTLTIGRDPFRFQVTSDRDGFMYLIGLGPDGTLAQLVPNTRSGPRVRIRKDQPWRFPTGDRFELVTQDPPGPTRILVIVSERERDFAHLELQAADPIRLFPGQDALQRVAASPAAGTGALLAGRPDCPAGAACNDAYGAALLRFDTVRP
jgi:serine/threonine protein kinase